MGILAREGARAPTVTALTYPGDCAALLAALAKRGYVIGPGYGALGTSSVRIGHMGDHTLAATQKLLHALEEAMIETQALARG